MARTMTETASHQSIYLGSHEKEALDRVINHVKSFLQRKKNLFVGTRSIGPNSKCPAWKYLSEQ